MNRDNNLKRKLFDAITTRVDTYAIQNENGYARVSEPLTIDQYLDPNQTVGAYLVGLDGKVKCAVIDIDVNKDAMNGNESEDLDYAKIQTMIITKVLEEAGFKVHLEFSGRKGYHIWLFFDEPVPAKDVRCTLLALESKFYPKNGNIHWEIFPKQDHVDKNKFGNLIKLPLQTHRVSGTQSYMIDDFFHPVQPATLSFNSKELLLTAPEKAETETFKGVFEPPSNINLMFEKCHVLKGIEQHANSSYLEGTHGHERRLFLGSQMKPFGEKGRKRVHEILKHEPDYDESKTDRQLDSIKGPPQTCSYMCKDKPCANIRMAGGKSPIKFGYMDNLYQFLEKQTSSYAYYDRVDEQIYFVDSEGKLKKIFASANQELSEKYDTPKIIFDPSSDLTIGKDRKTINLFKPTDYMVRSKNPNNIDLQNSCPNILRLLTNLIPIQRERERFLNWLAGIMQTREKQLTAWVFMGEPGAGKNVLLDHVLKPLFGSKQAIKVEDEQLRNAFNPWLQNALIIAFNEVAHDNRTRNSINSKVKAIITDNEMAINEKNVKMFTIDNNVNALFFSNNEIPVLIEENDRRFNVVKTKGDLRKNSWFSDPEKFFTDVASELSEFAQYLINYTYDPILAKTVISNDQKKSLVRAGMNRFEEFALHLKANDVQWFIENVDDPYLIRDLEINGKIEKSKALSLFQAISGDERVKIKKLTTELGLYGIRISRKRNEENRPYYYEWE